MLKLFIETSQFKDEILKACGELFSFEESPKDAADIVISDSIDSFQGGVKDRATKLFLGAEKKPLIDSYYTALGKTQLNGVFSNSPMLPQIVAEECSRIANEFTTRGLSLLSSPDRPILFDSLFSSSQAGKIIDDIYAYTEGKIKEEILRNILTSQILMTFYCGSSGPESRLDFEFTGDENRFTISTSIKTRECSHEKILSYLKDNRSVCRNLFEDANMVSITYLEDAIKILSVRYVKDMNPGGINIYSSEGREEDIADQIIKDRTDGLNYISFTKVKNLITSGTSLEEALKTEGRQMKSERDDSETDKQWVAVDRRYEELKRSAAEMEKETRALSGKMKEILQSKVEDREKLKELEKIQGSHEILYRRFNTLSENLDRIREENISIKQQLVDQRRRGLRDEARDTMVQEEVEYLKKEVNSLSSSRKQLMVDMENMRIAKEELEQKLRQHDARGKGTDAQLVKLKDELERIGASEIKLKKEHRETVASINIKNREIDSLKREIGRLKVELQHAEKTAKEIKKSNLDAKSTENFSQKLKRAEMRAQNSESQVDILKKTVVKLEESEKKLKKDTRDLMAEINRKDGQTEKLKKDVNRLRIELESVQSSGEEKKVEQTKQQSTTVVRQDNKAIEEIQKSFASKERKYEQELQKMNALIVNLKKAQDSSERQLKNLREGMTEANRRLSAEKEVVKKKEAKIRELSVKLERGIK